MTTIIINEKTKKGQIILDLVREMGAGKIIEEKPSGHLPNGITLKAIEDAKKGKTVQCTDFDDYIEKVK